MGAQLGTKGAFGEINMTPLIDIVLVVLIIMMVNVPVEINEMGIKLPSQLDNIDRPPPENSESLVINVYEPCKLDDAGQPIKTPKHCDELALNRHLAKENRLVYEVTRRLRPMEKKNVYIDAHPLADYGRVIDMVDLAREAGAAKVGLSKMKPYGPAEPVGALPGALPKGVTVGNPAVVGYMTEVKAEKALKRILPGIKGCYFNNLRSDPSLTGRMLVRVQILPDGSLKSPQIKLSTLGSEPLKDCIQPLIEKLEFEPLGDPRRTAAIDYPLLFSPG